MRAYSLVSFSVPLTLSLEEGHHSRHPTSTFSAAIVKVTYGVDIDEKDDPNIALLESGLNGGAALTPGEYLVGLLPFLQYVPAWVPGAGFQKDFAQWSNDLHQFRDTLFQRAKEQTACPFLIGAVTRRT